MGKRIIVIAAFLLVTQTLSPAVTRRVPSEYPNIQYAIEACIDGDVVVVAPGTYTGEGNHDIDFEGKAVTVRSTDPNDPNIVASTIIDCQESGEHAGRGFYFHNLEDANSVLAGLTITRGNAEWGGGVYCDGCSSPIITNCTFTGNSARFGGGVFKFIHSKVTLTNCIFRGNSASDGGGGIFSLGLRANLTNCIFIGNSANWSGGAAWGNIYAVNCIFSGNSANESGGGASGNIHTVNCVFSGNSAGLWGGAIYNHHPTPRVTNCILWGDMPEEIYVDSGTPVVDYSCIQGGWSGPGNIEMDPCFVSPGYWVDVNDPNIVVEPNEPDAVWIDGDYRLLASSLCIDAGDNNSVPADTTDLDGDGDTDEPIPWDLAGNPRIVDGNNDGLAVVDMGAYEYFVPPIEVAMKFTPQALNPGSKGRWVKAHFVLPEEYMPNDVDANSPAKITEPFERDIDSNYVDVFINESNLVEVEAAFERSVFCEAGISDEAIEVMVIGSFTSGQQFYGTDTIKVTTNYLKYLGVLASHWLEEECDKPDWCEGADLDQDSVVDFVDFSLYDGCGIEVVTE